MHFILMQSQNKVKSKRIYSCDTKTGSMSAELEPAGHLKGLLSVAKPSHCGCQGLEEVEVLLIWPLDQCITNGQTNVTATRMKFSIIIVIATDVEVDTEIPVNS